MSDFANNLHEVIERIEKARLSVSAHHIVKLVAVSKYSTAQDVQELFTLGQRAFGENRVQDFIDKSTTLEHIPLEWHFMGRLQSNKINHLIDASPSLVHSIDSLELAQAINSRLEKKNETFDALLQINSANEATKQGVAPALTYDTFHAIKQTCPRINLKGLMTIGTHTNDTHAIAKSFELTYAQFERLKSDDVTILSMGMSSDYELAIKCGSTMVRVGSALFK